MPMRTPLANCLTYTVLCTPMLKGYREESSGHFPKIYSQRHKDEPIRSKTNNSSCEEFEMARLLFGLTVKEFHKGACLGVFLGMAFFFTLVPVSSEVTSSGLSAEKFRSFHRTRHLRAVDSTGRFPYFDNSTARNITTSAGKTTYLPCRVRYLGDRAQIFNGSFPVSNFQVSWIRRKDLHVLTVGKFSYTNDQRFQVIHLDGSDDWTLQIKYAQRNDAGVYECQVSTVPKMSHFVTLNVIVSKATIVGRPALYINSGSTLNLTCLVMESPVLPDYVFWYHNGKVINYDTPRGISVHTEKAPKTTSKLLIRNAQTTDSGNYSCVPSNADPADIAVHVLNGQHPAAMQHGKHTSSAPGHDYTNYSSSLIICLFVVLRVLIGQR